MGQFTVGDSVKLVGTPRSVTVEKGHAALLLPSNAGSSLCRYRVLVELDVDEGDLQSGNPPIGDGKPYKLKRDLGTITMNDRRLGTVLSKIGASKYRVRFYYPLVRNAGDLP